MFFFCISTQNSTFAFMEHSIYMQRCLQLAQNGLGNTYPNPMVGCVIVHNRQIIGEGWHVKAGKPHAEVRAIASVKNQDLLPESTLYVSLEPCSHFGKTPPCADLIISKNIKNIIVGTTDPFSEVAGRGIAKLQQAGCNVTVGVLQNECQEINKRFFTFHNKKRPYIILKWAETSDRFIAPLNKTEKRPVWISGRLSRQLVHKWRSEEQAILVGKNTILQDNPSLTTRYWSGKNPLRLAIDSNGDIPPEFAIYNTEAQTITLTSEEKKSIENSNFQQINFQKSLPEQICNFLFKKDIQSVIIEGGTLTLQQFIDANLWDEARVFVGATTFKRGIAAPLLSVMPYKHEIIGNDKLLWYKNLKS